MKTCVVSVTEKRSKNDLSEALDILSNHLTGLRRLHSCCSWSASVLCILNFRPKCLLDFKIFFSFSNALIIIIIVLFPFLNYSHISIVNSFLF